MTQLFLVLKACSHNVYEQWMRNVFSNKQFKKSYDAFFGVWFLKLKQQDTRVNYNKDSVTQRWVEKKKKREKTKKARQTTIVCNFQSIKSPVELNSLFSKFFCCIIWFVKSPDYTRNWTTCKQGLYVKSYYFFETIVCRFKNYKQLNLL